MRVQVTELSREDNLLMAINGLTSVEEPYFDIIQDQMYNQGLSDFNRRLQIDFTLDPRVTIMERQVYNVFMLLGDVGGFSGLLFTLGAILIGIVNF